MPINPRLEELARRLGNEELPKEKPPKPEPVVRPFENVKYTFLSGDLGQSVLGEYQGRVQRDYNGNSALDVLSFSDDVVKGSNPFAFVLLNQIVSEKGMRIATPADLERALKEGEIDLKGTYGDSALVLRSGDNPNEYLAKNLIEQLQRRGSVQYPLMMPLIGLELKSDTRSPHGLTFVLTNSSEAIYAPQLEHANDCKKFSEADEKGLPIFNDNGTRTLYTRNSGLSRLYRNGDLNLDARDGGLTSSNSDGRVILCAEGTSR